MKEKKRIKPGLRMLSAVMLVLVCLGAVLVGCQREGADVSGAAEQTVQTEETGSPSAVGEAQAPHTKEDGSKYRVAYLDYDEYLPASRQLYYILAGLEELGWIRKGSLPFTAEDIDAQNLSTRSMYEALLQTDLGPYLEFVPGGFFYLAYDDQNEVAKALKTRAGTDIDLIITFGTSAGVFTKELELPVPMIDFSATDPVASGIIASATEGSGSPYVWAQVEPAFVYRQLKYYHSIQSFRRLGVIIYGDETISGVPDIENAAQDFGFQLVKYNIEEQPRETAEELERYYELVREGIEAMAEEDIDAFYLTIDLINDLSRMESLLEPLYEKKLPIYLTDDVEAVRHGGLMLIAVNDLVNVGRFIADATSRILNGADAGKLPCVYSSAPGIYLNYDVAKRIQYPLKFGFLVSCDEIFTKGGSK